MSMEPLPWVEKPLRSAFMTAPESPIIARSGKPPFDRRAVAAWCLYDWANSPFPTVVTTFIFAAYYTSAVAADAGDALAQWGVMQGQPALVIALVSPVLGAIADRGGRRKPWLAVFTLAMAAGSGLLWLVHPDPGDAWLLLWLVGLAMVAFEVGMVFYNAMLPSLAPYNWLGRVSGWAWGLGYFGGLSCLAILLYGFIQTEAPPFGLAKESAQHVRIAGPFVALWIVLFSLPVFLYTPDRAASGVTARVAVREGLATLWHTLRHLRQYGSVARFLVARFFYTDGINTLFIFGGIYAAGTFGMNVGEVAMFGILLNVTAGLGAFGFAWIDDYFGAKRTILIALAGILLVGVPILIITSKMWFYILGAVLGIFFGPAQAASRSLMARMAPEGMETEMFGLFALTGKAAAILSPLTVALVVTVTGSQRAAMATVLPVIMIGALILLKVRDPAEEGSEPV